MRISFRDSFYFGLGLALLAGLFLLWLWRPERQVRLHTEHLLRQIELRNWSNVEAFIGPSYHDEWGHDRRRLVDNLHQVLRVVRDVRLTVAEPQCAAEGAEGVWRGRVRLDCTGEYASMIKERVNSLTAPFELSWRHDSSKPWDWQLVSIGNPELQAAGDLP